MKIQRLVGARLGVLSMLGMMLPALGSTASLQSGSLAGDTANAVATCLPGDAYANGGADTRFCTQSALANNASSSTYIDSPAAATFASGITASADAWGTLGTLHGASSTTIPLSDGFHNAQSNAQIRMQDSILASDSSGSLYLNYKYTVVIAGSKTASSDLYAWPVFGAGADVNFDIGFPSCATCNDVILSWSATDAAPSGVITGTLSVPPNRLISLDLTLAVNSGVNTDAAGQSGTAQADYSDTVHLYFDALTPGANTVGQSGFDYATPVPEPQRAFLMVAGTLLLGLRLRSIRVAEPLAPARH